MHRGRHWPLEGSCKSHIPKEHLELAREKTGEGALGHSHPAFRIQRALTRAVHAGGEGQQAHVRHRDGAGNPVPRRVCL